MKFISISIETNTLYANAQCLLGNGFAYDFSRFYISGIRQLVGLIFRSRTGRSKRRPSRIIDYLSINMLVRAKNRQPRPVRRSKDLCPNMIPSPESCFLYFINSQFKIPNSIFLCRSGGKRFTDLTTYLFVGITDSFSLVRFGRSHFTDIRCELSQ